MGRALGRIRHSKAVRMRMIIGNLYSYYYDPAGTLRHRGKNKRTDPFHMVPNMPSLCLYGHPQVIDFKSALDVDITDKWAEYANPAGTGLAVQDERGGVAKFTNAALDDSYHFYFSTNEVWKLMADKGLWFRTHIKLADVDQADMFVGLSAKLGSGDIFDNRVDSIGFYLTDGSASLRTECRKDSTATAATGLSAMSDNSLITLSFRVIENYAVIFWINDTFAAEIKTNLPDDEEMAFVFGCRNGQASANSMSIGRTIIFADEEN